MFVNAGVISPRFSFHSSPLSINGLREKSASFSLSTYAQIEQNVYGQIYQIFLDLLTKLENSFSRKLLKLLISTSLITVGSKSIKFGTLPAKYPTYGVLPRNFLQKKAQASQTFSNNYLALWLTCKDRQLHKPSSDCSLTCRGMPLKMV